MLTSTRRRAILTELHDAGEVSVALLAQRFDVSTSTIRRDLNRLSRQGQLERVRGGGTIEADVRPFNVVAASRHASRERLGAAAAELVADRDVVILDIGTTVAQVARFLRGRRLTVVTASLAVVDVLRDDSMVELVVLGGVLRPSYLSLVGSLPEQALRGISADLCMLGASGVSNDGHLLDSTGIEVPIKHAIIASAQKRVLVADEDKFPGSGTFPVCGPEQIDVLVTTHTAASVGLDQLRTRQAEVRIA